MPRGAGSVVQRTFETNQEDLRHIVIVGAVVTTGSVDRARDDVEGKSLRRCVHWDQCDAVVAVTVSGDVVLGEATAGQGCRDDAHDDRK